MTITRDPATGLVTATDLGVIHETRTYDAYGAEQHYTVTANGATLYDVDYGTRDPLGRIVQKTETVQGTTHVYGYNYDVSGRLADVITDGSATSHYEYDANGNRLVGPGLTASPAYDNQDRLLSYGDCTYAYKNDGSLQTKTCPSGTTTYDYDAFGNLRGVTLPSGTAITYLIDGQNRRVGKKINGALVESFVYEDDLKRVGWYDGTGALKAQFVFGNSGSTPDLMTIAGVAYRLVVDETGSIRVVVASNGTIAQSVSYDEFGQVTLDTSPGFQPFGFAGGLRDQDSSLTRFGSRDYAPAEGRWTTRDPLRISVGNTSAYSYADDDPVNRADPSGRETSGYGDQCVEPEFGCPQSFTDYCGKGVTCRIKYCGHGACPHCPQGANSVIVQSWCSYECDNGGAAFGYKVFFKNIWVGPFCIDPTPKSCQSPPPMVER